MTNFRFIYKNENNIKYYGEVKNNRLIDYGIANNNLIGNIYRAKVEKYINSLKAYIVEIGEEKKALLKNFQTIEDVKPGQDIIVELTKYPDNNKLIEVTQKITISDGYIVLSPHTKSNNMNKKYNYFLRTKSKYLEDKEIDIRYNNLIKKFNDLLKEKHRMPTPKLLVNDKFIKNYILDYEGITVSNVKNLLNTKYENSFNPKYVKEINDDLVKLDSKKVKFKDGEIVIDQLEALTVIDVNSDAKNLNLSKEDLSIKTNISSLEEIAIQISIRKIKKMLIIDFIRMNNKNKTKLNRELINTFNRYNFKYKSMGFTDMGLYEIIIF